MANAGQAESHCVDGDIRLVAGEIESAAGSFLQAHIADGPATIEHIETLAADQRESLREVLQSWTEPGEARTILPDGVATEQVWEFIFRLAPETVTSFYTAIDNLFAEEKYYQIISCTTAILKQHPPDVVPLILQRGLARTLMGGSENDAISDYLRAYLKDKEATIEVVKSRQSAHFVKVLGLMRNCVYSMSPAQSDGKAYKQWVALTIDCCRFLLTFEPDNFSLQMTFVSRLIEAHRYDRAVAMLDEVIKLFRNDPDKLTEVLLRKSLCYFAKQDNDQAVHDVTHGLNARTDLEREKKQNVDDDVILQYNKSTVDIATRVFDKSAKSLLEVVALLDKFATRLGQEERFKSAVKLENIRTSIDIYRAVLTLQPDNMEAKFKLATSYSKFGQNKFAVRLLNELLEKSPLDAAVLAARAACYRELGNKVGAKNDYDLLLRHNSRDVTLLCERALVCIDDEDLTSAANDLLVAFKFSPKLVIGRLNREPLVRRTRTRQTLFDFAKSKLKQANDDDKTPHDGMDNDASSVAMGISHLLTKLNPADQSCHILEAHAMFHSGCSNDAETKLKKMLQDKKQGIDSHVIKLHLGIMKVFTKRRDEGITDMIEVLASKGERVFLSILRDIPLTERSKLSEESHLYGISILQRSRDADSVRRAVNSFSIAILFCRETDLVLEGRNEGTGFYRSYLARAECMAHLGEQRAAIMDFSAAIEIQPTSVDGLCGRAFMRLALGEEADCIADITIASDLNLANVVEHINALPEEAKKLLLFWIDHRVVALLLNYGYRANDRINTGGSASTISMLDETVFKPGEDVSRSSSLSSIHPPSITDSLPVSSDVNAAAPTDVNNTTPADVNRTVATDVNMTAATEGSATATTDVNKTEAKQALHKSEVTSDELNQAISSLNMEANNEQPHSRGSSITTATSMQEYDEPMNSMEKLEILNRALALGRLLVTIDDDNASWQGMLADILIVKGDYEEALCHLQIVMELTPHDVTATARAGLINVRINRYKIACRLLGGISSDEVSGVKYVLKALDATRRRRLCEESFNYAEALNRESKYAAARDCYALSLLADRHMRLDSLRMRSRCHARLGNMRKALTDIGDVIKELARKPQSHDYCYRGSLYLLENKDFQACRDYMKAIEIDRDQAISLIHARPGRNILCDVFYKQAQISFTRHNYQECADLCEFALIIDDSNIDVRKLRARAKRETSKCNIQ